MKSKMAAACRISYVCRAMTKTRTSRTSRTLLDQAEVRLFGFYPVTNNENSDFSNWVHNVDEKRLGKVRGPTFRLLPYNK